MNNQSLYLMYHDPSHPDHSKGTHLHKVKVLLNVRNQNTFLALYSSFPFLQREKTRSSVPYLTKIELKRSL